MNAIELADEFKNENIDWNEDNLRHWGIEAETMLRQQQAKIISALEIIKCHEESILSLGDEKLKLQNVIERLYDEPGSYWFKEE